MLDRRSVGLHVMPIASATLSDGRNRENAPRPSAIYVLVTELGPSRHARTNILSRAASPVHLLELASLLARLPHMPN